MPTSRITTSGSWRRKSASAATNDASKYDSVTEPSARATLLEDFHELGIGRIDAVDADALVEPPQMRRRERADVVAGVPVDALEHRDARALAVRAGDGDDLVRRSAQLELVEHGDEAVETQIDPLRMHRLEPSEPTIERLAALRRSRHEQRASGLRTTRAGSRASRAAPRSDRGPADDRGSCRSRPSRAGIPRAGNLRAAFHRSSAR